MSAPKILLTGSRGVLGRAILDALVSDGHHVRVVSRDKAYKPAHDCEVVVGDLTDWIFTESLAQNCDVVIHCAGEKRDAARFESGNINTTENLIGAANKNRKIYNISRDHQENETYRTLVEMLSEESVKEISLPIHIIHWLRLMKNGYSNLGNKTYSGALLTDEGFEYPHALEALIKDAKNNER